MNQEGKVSLGEGVLVHRQQGAVQVEEYGFLLHIGSFLSVSGGIEKESAPLVGGLRWVLGGCYRENFLLSATAIWSQRLFSGFSAWPFTQW